jgi:copper(I)-binding protein
MKKISQALQILLLTWLFAGTTLAEDRLQFTDAWIRAMPPGMGMTAGFGRLTNAGAAELVLVSFSSPLFGSVSLHRSERVDGVSRMREVESLRLEPGQVVELAPGGYHLMLMSPGDGIGPGAQVPVDMTAAGGERFRFLLPVERR